MRNTLVIAVLASSLAQAAPPAKAELPALLADWSGWVLHGEKEIGCPFLQGQDGRQCSWPGRLGLTLDEKGGRFTQSFKVYREAWLSLPGDVKHWPQNVQVDGKPAVVAPGPGSGGAGNERPAVKLSPGEHSVTGDFLWDTLPEAVEIPPGTGLLSLTLKGRAVAMPNRDEEGRVYLQKESRTQETERLELTVHRRVTDEIPLTLTTRVSLNVSGQSREVLLGRALPEGFVPMSLSAGLPVRVDPDGKLRLQVRPGNWVVELVARNEGLVTKLARPAPGGTWADGEEVWVFDARPSLRQVLVEGVNAVEPNQTTLPGEWKRYPAYSLGEKDVMLLTERRRGDADPPPDVLDLERKLWLDFDGEGYTASDRITGQLHRSWRLEMQPGTELGRVVSAGADQSITRLGPGRPAGVELRQGGLTLEADSRISGQPGAIPAVSWDADFRSVRTTLQLPPGWSLFHASGADKVPETWVQQWSLLDIFLVLVIAIALGRLFGPRWGAVALLTLTLAWQEDSVPQYVWLAVLVGEALLRVLPESWFREAVRLYRFATWAALVLIAMAFMVQHVRQGMYPALAQHWRQLGAVKSWSEYSSENVAQYERSNIQSDLSGSYGEPQGQMKKKMAKQEEPEDEKDDRVANAPQVQVQEQQAVSGKGRRSFNVRDYDKNAMVQTGPGLPRWEWKSIAIWYSGPVQRAQPLGLYLINPTVNLVLTFVRVLLLALLVLCALGFPGGFWPQSWRRTPPAPMLPGSVVGALLALCTAALLLVAAPARAQELPSPELLEQLKARLLEKPECAPTCASSPRLLLEASPGSLRLRLEVLAGAETAVPLPGHARHWVPETVTLDGKPAAGLWRRPDGTLWLAVSEGAHQVLVEGPLPARETVQVELPLKSLRVEAKLEGWTLDGLHEDGIADQSLQLTRKAGAEKGTKAALQTGTLPPFVRVERSLVLGLQWSVETKVVRLTPVGSAVVLEVPLLAGESVTSSELRVQGGKALVNMPAHATEVSWSSVLETKSPIELTAPKNTSWMEVWRLDVSPVWHVQLSGIPVVHQQDASGAKLPEWRPWPGEAVRVEVLKPEGVQGQTLTIDQSSLNVSPGVRATDATFTANMRSSRGGLHTFLLPEGGELGTVTVNGAQQPIRQEGRKVSIPLVPGSQNLVLSWRQADGLTTSWATPQFAVNLNTVNAALTVHVPDDRWVLFVWGPRMGPAVLFWSFLLVLLLISVGLGRVRLTPLTTLHWVLLAVGLSQMPIPAIAFVFAWLLFLGWRQHQPELPVGWFNLRQLALAAVTLAALIIVMVSVYEGLLGRPEMQIQGNGSSASALHWFTDRTDTAFPMARMVTVPMLIYRGAMLGWSLWMALALLRWLKWGWAAFATGGLWRHSPKPAPQAPPPKG